MSSSAPPTIATAATVRKAIEANEEVVVVGRKRSSTNSKSNEQSVHKKKTKTDESNEVDNFGIPKHICHFPIKGKHVTSTAFLHFCELARVYSKTYHFNLVPFKSNNDAAGDNNDDDETKTKKGKAKKKHTKKRQTTLFSNRGDTKTYGNICLLCLRAAIKEPNAPSNVWTTALCNVKGNPSNTDKHLCMKHRDEDEIKDYLSNKEMQKVEQIGKALSGKLVQEFTKSRVENLHEKMIDWLIAFGVPHKATQTEEFIRMFRIFDPQATAVSRERFIAGLDKRFENASY